MCDCLKKTKAECAERAKPECDKFGATILYTEAEGEIMFMSSGANNKTYTEVTVVAGWTSKAGKPMKKKVLMNMIHRFCPFCGVAYDEVTV